MTIVKVEQVGSIGVVKDLSQHELPQNAWTDAKNIRFLDGYAYQFYGHDEVYNSPSYVPQFVREAEKFGIDLAYAKDQAGITKRLTVTNYERLENFHLEQFGAVPLMNRPSLKTTAARIRHG